MWLLSCRPLGQVAPSRKPRFSAFPYTWGKEWIQETSERESGRGFRRQCAPRILLYQLGACCRVWANNREPCNETGACPSASTAFALAMLLRGSNRYSAAQRLMLVC